jgi:multiple sugar transport system permease protein
VKPALAALSVLIFTFIWNRDYFWAIVLAKADESQPVTAGITLCSQFSVRLSFDERGQRVRRLPRPAMFFLMQKHLHRSHTRSRQVMKENMAVE